MRVTLPADMDNSSSSLFSHLDNVPLDPHFALKELFDKDKNPDKVLLGSGVYRDDNGRPWVLPAVKKAEVIVTEEETNARYEYLPIPGYAPFYAAARDLLFGPTVKKDRTVSVHTISGTGANYLGARFLSQALKPSAVWVSDPTWVNHINIWNQVGVEVKTYPYWNARERTLAFEETCHVLETQTRPGDVIVLHACAHNPTGVDPTKEQWKIIADICEEHALFPFFDCAYQGFATGDLDDDAWALRHFMERGTLELAVAQSFSKNMGLYGERVGAFHLATASPATAVKVQGHLARLQRGQISQPPTRGAKIATAILTRPELFKDWLIDLQEMSSRIKSMRKSLHEGLLSLNTPGKWDCIVSQIGMFSFTGLSPEEVAAIRADGHVYMLKSGRISVAGLNTRNIQHVVESMDAAVRKYAHQELPN